LYDDDGRDHDKSEDSFSGDESSIDSEESSIEVEQTNKTVECEDSHDSMIEFIKKG
jgi:hypothetical protein